MPTIARPSLPSRLCLDFDLADVSPTVPLLRFRRCLADRASTSISPMSRQPRIDLDFDLPTVHRLRLYFRGSHLYFC